MESVNYEGCIQKQCGRNICCNTVSQKQRCGARSWNLGSRETHFVRQASCTNKTMVFSVQWTKPFWSRRFICLELELEICVLDLHPWSKGIQKSWHVFNCTSSVAKRRSHRYTGQIQLSRPAGVLNQGGILYLEFCLEQKRLRIIGI